MLPELVFVGGQVAELLVSDPATVRIRPTDDVDVIVRVTTRSRYSALQERLGDLGFEPDMREGSPICRVRTQDDLVLDAMPLNEAILGFSNRWYEYAIESAVEIVLEPGLVIRSIDAPAFLATKFEAYAGRGGGDVLESPDIEDILTVIAGRQSIAQEVEAAPSPVREFIRHRAGALLDEPWIAEMLQNAVPDSRRVRGLGERMLQRLCEVAGR